MSKRSPSDARRRQLEAGTKTRQKELEFLMIRDAGICQLCLKRVAREDASRDHIKNVALCTKEEARDVNNMQLAHIICNNLKNMKPGAKFRTLKDSYDRKRLTQSIGSLFPSLSYVFPEANG